MNTQKLDMTVHIASILTEDGEEYKYAFYQKPSETKVKSIFFKEHGVNYSKKDWGSCIAFELEELPLHT